MSTIVEAKPEEKPERKIIIAETYLKNTRHYVFKGYFPTITRPEGECYITFKRMRNHTITLGHAQILSHFVEGSKTALGSDTYGLFAESPHFLGDYVITLLSQDFRITIEEAHELCDLIIHFSLRYVAVMKSLNKMYGFDQFEKSQRFQNGYRLLKTDRRLWKAGVEFAKKNDHRKGNSDWHIFEAKSGFIIVNDSRYKMVIYPEQVDNSFGSLQYPDHEVWLVWQLLHGTENGIILEDKNYIEMLHGPLQAFLWITQSLIPAITYYQLNKDASMSYESYMKTFRLQDYCGL